MSKKKKILWLSDFSRLQTGFGKNSKQVLLSLYKTGKYEIIEYACYPLKENEGRLDATPWKSYGAISSDDSVLEEISESTPRSNATKYGHFFLNGIIKKEKPDIFIGVNDFWGFEGLYDEPWWNDINCALWVTIDSLPIYPPALENASKIKNFWVWSEFAETEFRQLGFTHVKTKHGAFDTSNFSPAADKKELREKHGIAEDDFIVGFVFKNQRRKLVGTLIEGFSLHKKSKPDSKAKLLLHTCWTEGWNIESFIKEFGVENEDVLTTYYCKSCRAYKIAPYQGENKQCGSCGQNTFVTPNAHYGVDEKQMSEIYNLMDYYVHPATSGGLEMPIVEALLCGVPTAVPNYSFGEEFCKNYFVDSINFTTHRDFESQFIKCQPSAAHIAELIGGAPNTDLANRSIQGIRWAQENYDKTIICDDLMEWIDSCPEPKRDYRLDSRYCNESYPNKPITQNDEWAIDLVNGVFGAHETADSDTIKKIVKKIEESGSRLEIYNKTIESAQKINAIHKKEDYKEYIKDIQVDCSCLLLPREKADKITCDFSLLAKETPNLFLIGEAGDEELFLEVGDFEVIPRTKKTSNKDWVFALKNSEGKPHFKEFITIENGEFKKTQNDSK